MLVKGEKSPVTSFSGFVPSGSANVFSDLSLELEVVHIFSVGEAEQP